MRLKNVLRALRNRRDVLKNWTSQYKEKSTDPRSASNLLELEMKAIDYAIFLVKEKLDSGVTNTHIENAEQTQ